MAATRLAAVLSGAAKRSFSFQSPTADRSVATPQRRYHEPSLGVTRRVGATQARIRGSPVSAAVIASAWWMCPRERHTSSTRRQKAVTLQSPVEGASADAEL